MVSPGERAGEPAAAFPLKDLLAIVPFRRLWIALGFSSLGDWLGILATTALAASYGGRSYLLANFAVGAVLVVRLLPSLLLGPIAGAWVDKLDRRRIMIIADLVRFSMYASIPLVGTWWWLLAATLLAECASIFWIPAKEATVPNLVPRDRLEPANRLSLVTTYGTAPVAAVLFSLLATVGGLLERAGSVTVHPVDVALYADAATFLFSAYTITRLKVIRSPGRAAQEHPGLFRQIREGWSYIGHDRLVRGLVLGMLGAFASGGAVIGVARVFVGTMHGGDAAYGVLFGAVFTGMAGGMFAGPRLLRGFSRRRLFGMCLAAAGAALVAVSALAELVLVVFLTALVGAFAGMAWVIGYTLVGLEVADRLRGRTFAFLQTMVRVVLILVLAMAPIIAGAIGPHRFRVSTFEVRFDGSNAVILLAGLLTLVMGVVSFRQMDDRPGVPIRRDVLDALRGTGGGEPVRDRVQGVPEDGGRRPADGARGGKDQRAEAPHDDGPARGRRAGDPSRRGPHGRDRRRSPPGRWCDPGGPTGR
ncbi:hypothetical protein GCM10023085_20830 [Actinomadura viridis]|uniref:dTMP kinase n=1 Tax=Actinomadura viridis TaxID=58110 RepID=A0A931DLB4_9ACTN|nr:MFS transporter [Actinomadura viridis]MBG6089160.1 dTMP kinase [Actinomadura viridis]